MLGSALQLRKSPHCCLNEAGMGSVTLFLQANGRVCRNLRRWAALGRRLVAGLGDVVVNLFSNFCALFRKALVVLHETNMSYLSKTSQLDCSG